MAEHIPTRLQERIFVKLFEAAELARYNPQERMAYQDSMKYYRDIKNVMDTQFEEGSKQRALEIAFELKRLGINIDIIAQSTGLSSDEIAGL